MVTRFHLWLSKVLPLLLVLASSSCALGMPEAGIRGMPGGTGAEVRPDDDAMREAALRQDLVPFIRNGSFEELTPSGHPRFWDRVGEPEVRTEVLSDLVQNNYIRVNNAHPYSHPILFPVGPWQSIMIGSSVRSDFERATPRLSYRLFNAAGERGFWGNLQTSEAMEPDQWTDFRVTLTRGIEDERVTFLYYTRRDVTWVDVDDVYMLTEAVPNGNFEGTITHGEPGEWELSAGASITVEDALQGDRSLLLSPDATASIITAHSPRVVRYFLTGLTSDELLVEEIRYLPLGTVADGSTSMTVTPDETGRFLLDLPQSPDGQSARVNLINTGGNPVMVDDVSRGFAYVRPEVFAPVANSPAPSMRLTAAWPEHLATARIDILDGEGGAVDEINALTIDRGAAWAEYNGGSLPAGVYTARFHLTSTAGTAIALDRPFEIKRGEPFMPRPTTVRRMEFASVPWIFLIPFSELDTRETADQIEEKLQLAKDDGFTFFWLNALEEQFPAVREAAERVGVPYIMYEPTFPSEVFRLEAGNNTWDPYAAHEKLSRFDVFLGSDLFQGIYIMDEPNVAEPGVTDQVRDLMRVMEQEGKYPPGYTFLSAYFDYDGTDYNLMSVYHYPVAVSQPDPREALAIFLSQQEAAAGYARQLGRTYWAGVQGFSNFPSAVVMRPAETRAMMGLTLAVGSKGYFEFLYNAINQWPTLRDHQFDETPLLQPFREFNERTTAISPLLLSLEIDEVHPATDNIVARSARDQMNNVYTIIVNTMVDRQALVSIEETAPGGREDVESGVVHPPGAEILLAPGDWRILRMQSGQRPASVSAVGIDPQVGSPIELPLTAMLQVGENVSRLDVDTAGEMLAAIVPSGAAVFSIAEADLGMELFRTRDDTFRGSPRFLDDDRLAIMGRRTGYRLYDTTAQPFEIVEEYFRENGGARGIIVDGPRRWVAQSYWGVGLIEPGDDLGSFSRLAQFPSQEFDFIDVYGPWPDGSIIAVDDVRGIYRLRYNGEEIEGEWLDTARAGSYHGAISPSMERLALPVLSGHVRIVRFDNEANIVSQFEIRDEELVQPVGVDWLSEDTLAVADSRGTVRFYRLATGGGWLPMGLWQPPGPPVSLLTLRAMRDGQFAVSAHGGRLYVVDGSPVLKLGRSAGWATY